jgi:pyruvate/2-oxoglutarate dehydrogenase complex dihydrolipoamide acyltransferase (E2) component
MSKKDEGYEVIPFPKIRRLMVDGGRMGRQKHMVHGLVEMDVTRARQAIQADKTRTGEGLSFSAFMISCLGRAVDMNRHMHAYRNWRDQLVIFDEVDVNTLFEVDVEGRKIIRTHILRAVNKKSVRELHDEIRSFQAGHGAARETQWINRFVLLPGFIRRIVYRFLFKDPRWIKDYYGTVILSSVGMFGTGGGWAIPVPNHTLQITLGGIAERPGVVEGEICIREYLSVTVSFDHDIVDGAPAARFVQRYKELVESGYGLANL